MTNVEDLQKALEEWKNMSSPERRAATVTEKKKVKQTLSFGVQREVEVEVQTFKGFNVRLLRRAARPQSSMRLIVCSKCEKPGGTMVKRRRLLKENDKTVGVEDYVHQGCQ